MQPIFSGIPPVNLAASLPGLLLAFHLSIAVAAPATLPDIQHLLKAGQFVQALDKVDAYISAQQKEATGRFLKGVILTELGRPTEAIAVFATLAEDFPQLPEPYNNLAVLYAQQQQYDKARMALEMALKTHPSYAVAHENLGDIYAKLASQSYDRALQRDSSHTVAQSPLSLIRDLTSTPAKAALAKVANSANVGSNPVQAKPAAGKLDATANSTSQGNLLAVDSSAGDAGISKIIQHWSSAWSRLDFSGAVSYLISDLTCRALREKISSPGLLIGPTGSGAATGCRSELRKSRFW